jgi:hypothetical protein
VHRKWGPLRIQTIQRCGIMFDVPAYASIHEYETRNVVEINE